MASADDAIRQMHAVARGLENVGPRVVAAVAREMQGELRNILADEFNAGVDPEGASWAPLKKATLARGRTPPPLTATGKMRRSIKAVRRPTSVAIDATALEPAVFHQHGTKHMAARPIWPAEGSVPDRYAKRLEEAALRAGAQVLSGSVPH